MTRALAGKNSRFKSARSSHIDDKIRLAREHAGTRERYSGTPGLCVRLRGLGWCPCGRASHMHTVWNVQTPKSTKRAHLIHLVSVRRVRRCGTSFSCLLRAAGFIGPEWSTEFQRQDVQNVRRCHFALQRPCLVVSVESRAYMRAYMWAHM